MKMVMLVATLLLAFAIPAYADEQILYTSQPDEVTIFLNDVAFVRDTISVAGDANIEIVLPDQIYQDTLIVRENDARLGRYRINRSSGRAVLSITGEEDAELREITLEYLTAGLSWRPTYEMEITEGAETVAMSFFAEILNSAYTLESVDVTLAAGRVAATGQLDTVSTITANQYIAGYDSETAGTLATGAVTIQYLYPVGALDAVPGDSVYTQLLQATLPARRLLLWNARVDQQVTVIYKVRNDSEIPLAEGITRSYQDGLFIGSDFVEYTPVGSEGSITVGNLQDVRVNRSESISVVQAMLSDLDALHEVTLTLSNFSDNPVEIEVVDTWPPEAQDFVFSQEPQRDAGNLFRWMVTIPAGETITITYEFKAYS